jgi:3-dehydroquinate synthase
MSNPQLLEDVIRKCAALKAKIVEQDELEDNFRQILNFGHTVGHALEKYFGFDILRHGEAVSYGMLAAGKLSVEFTGLSLEDYDLLVQTIKRLPLPILPEFDQNKIIEIMATDKKVKDGTLNFVLISKIGETKIVDSISEEKIIEVLKLL